MNSITQRLLQSTYEALPKARKTIWWLLKIIIPTTLLVSFLQYWGIIALISSVLTPVFSLIGLSGESAIVFITSIFLPLYAPIAIIATLAISMREITILALMCLISHNMIVECAIQRKTGSSYIRIFVVRIAVSFLSAAILHQLLPDILSGSHEISTNPAPAHIGAMLGNWAADAGLLIIKVVTIITGLMVFQNILKEFKALTFLATISKPLMKIFGLSNQSSFLWLVAQTLGLTYGAAVMIEQVEQQDISKKDANHLNYHIAINHSLLEDTLLFVAIGVSAFWITIPRVLLAMLVVWSVRFFETKGIHL